MGTTTTDEIILIKSLFTRYQKVMYAQPYEERTESRCDYQSLIILCDEAIQNGHTYPMDKMHRWLGFVQGVLASRGVISIDGEREFTRPLFHKLYGNESKSFDT